MAYGPEHKVVAGSTTPATQADGGEATEVVVLVDTQGRVILGPDSVVSFARSEFTRINAKEWEDTEEVRFDIPADLTSAALYVGVAPAGTSTAVAAWNVVRTDFDANGNPSRQRIQLGIAWDARDQGWT